MTTPRWLSAVAGLATLLTSLLATPIATAADLPAVIRLGGQGAGFGKPYGTGLIGTLQAKGFLEEEFRKDNVKVEWTFFNGTGPAINEALANGLLDFANYGGLPNIVGKAGGLRTRILVSYGVGTIYVAARKDAPIASIADLKGRKVAVAKGTINHLSMNRLLLQNGLTEKDVQLVSLTASDQPPALTSGDVDAAFGTLNLLSLRDQGVVRIVADTRGPAQPASFFGALTVIETFADKYPEATRRVVKAYVKAAHWASLEENRGELIDLWSLSGTPRAVLAEELDGQDLKQRNTPLIDTFYRGQYEEAVRFALDNRLIRNSIDLDAWIDPAHLDAALKELGLESFWTPRTADGKPRA
ncbi:ABC transporter substrate-binding protein [Azospirillum argentinense]|uniref:Sulfate ester transporter substrate-binding protein n=1 Tax=Azospirillum brasilense TaxID=192 RepID=A0A4D8PUX0_AZOBR|nr:ABC transporter substrate-binding protein [Azospirillum argentinense]QCO00648.1 sulfate ester transporter substrate-binding protein [Azospirillum argentinense]